MTRYWPLVVAAAALVALLLWDGHRGREQSAWEAEIAAEAERTSADRERVAAEARLARLDRERAEAAEAAADSLASLRPRVVERIRVDTVPREVVRYTAPRDTLIGILTAEVDTLRYALRMRTQEADRLRSSVAVLDATVSRLERVIADRPKPRPAWMPMIVVGAAAGVDSSLRPFAGPAVTVGWQLKL